MQSLAIITDTFRSLKARGLYWVVLWISVVLGLVYASIGCNESGWYLLYGLIGSDSSWVRAGTEWEKSLLLACANGLMDYWLTSIALLLALFPTGTIFPDTMKPGAIDLLLSKPISKASIFFGKYIGALWFVGVQASILAIICFISLYLRLHIFYWGILWSVALSMLVFSFVYCFNVLIGVMTRSSMAALLWTVAFWFAIWLIQYTEAATGPKALAEFKSVTNDTPLAGISETTQKVHDTSAMIMNFLPRTRATAELFPRLAGTQPEYTLTEVIAGYRIFRKPVLEPVNFLALRQILLSGVVFEMIILALAFRHFSTRDF